MGEYIKIAVSSYTEIIQISLFISVIVLAYRSFRLGREIDSLKRRMNIQHLNNQKRDKSLDDFDQRQNPITGPDENFDDTEKVYDYEDPNFNLSAIACGQTGFVDAINGDAFYGNDKKYSSELYYGRVAKDAKIELLDKRVYKNEYEIQIIKIKVIENEWSDEIGKVGWIGLSVTNFRDFYNPATGQIDIP